MTPYNIGINSNKNKTSRKRLKGKNIACLLFISMFLVSSFFFNNLNLNNNTNSKTNLLDIDGLINYNSPKISTDPEDLFQNPYTVNFSKMWTFFSDVFESDLDYDVSLYGSESDDDGLIVDDTIYSKDNLLLYKSLIKEDYNSTEAYNTYKALKETPLWYSGNKTQFNYGFVSSIDGSTGAVIDDNRYLTDNLMPVFLLLGNEESNSEIHTELMDIYYLINSSQFYDSEDKGFYEYNKTVIYSTKSNFYAVLALFSIHQYDYSFLALDETLKLNIYNLANNTMKTLINKMWDNTNLGFYKQAGDDWIETSSTDKYKHLSTNALGIIALIDTWTKNGMISNSTYIKNATLLYNLMSRDSNRGGEGGLWNVSMQAYESWRTNIWGPDTNSQNCMNIDLESNALMMLACLKLFEATGNFTYYDKATILFETLRDKFYISSIDGNRNSIGAVNDSNVKLYSNLILSDTYLKAREIYKSTFLTANFNITDKVNFIMNQEFINLTCIYAYKKDIYKSSGGGAYTPVTIQYNNITGASINYIFKYPNGTNFEYIQNTFTNNKTTLIYPINDSLPLDDGYKIVIFANWTYFGFANASKTFNVISGLSVLEVNGLDDPLYQSQTTNITVVVQNDYNYNLTLNVTLYGSGIEEEPIRENIFFINNNKTTVSFNITIKHAATPGISTIYFTFVNGTIKYLEEDYEIEIINALSYSNLMYSEKVVAGKAVKVFLELINFLSNETQEFNLIFSGIFNFLINQTILLQAKERRTMEISVFTLPIISENSIQIDMMISKENKIFYEKELVINIVSKLKIKSVNFPEKVKQGIIFLGADSYLIIVIENNLDSSEEFTLFLNDQKIETNLDELVPGENRIEVKLSPAWNPYEFGTKSIKIEIEDDSEDVIYEKIIEYEIELSALNLIIFYILPILFLIGIVLYYKNKEIKNKLLRR